MLLPWYGQLHSKFSKERQITLHLVQSLPTESHNSLFPPRAQTAALDANLLPPAPAPFISAQIIAPRRPRSRGGTTFIARHTAYYIKLKRAVVRRGGFPARSQSSACLDKTWQNVPRRQHLLLRKDAVKREIVHSRTSHLSADADALAEISLI